MVLGTPVLEREMNTKRLLLYFRRALGIISKLEKVKKGGLGVGERVE